MSATATAPAGQGGVLGSVVDLFKAVVPQYLDYKYGRDPNAVYDAYGRPVYSFGPAGDGSADSARAQALYGNSPIGALPVGTVLLIAVGAFLLYKAA